MRKHAGSGKLPGKAVRLPVEAHGSRQKNQKQNHQEGHAMKTTHHPPAIIRLRPKIVVG
jgi:hypothetical protein